MDINDFLLRLLWKLQRKRDELEEKQRMESYEFTPKELKLLALFASWMWTGARILFPEWISCIAFFKGLAVIIFVAVLVSLRMCLQTRKKEK